MSILVDNTKELLANLGVDLVSGIARSGDPLTFGCDDKLVSVTSIIAGDCLENKVEVFAVKRSLLSKKILWDEIIDSGIIKMDLHSKIYPSNNVDLRVKEVISNMPVDFQKSILKSGEPVAFTYIDSDRTLQIEAIPVPEGEAVRRHIYSS